MERRYSSTCLHAGSLAARNLKEPGEKWRGPAHIFIKVWNGNYAAFTLELFCCLWKSHVNSMFEIHGSTFVYTYFYTLCLCCWYWKDSIIWCAHKLLHGALYWRDNDESLCHCFVNKILRSHQSCLGVSVRGFTKLICATLIFIATWCVLWISLVFWQWALFTIMTWIADVTVFICTWCSYHIMYSISCQRSLWKLSMFVVFEREYLHNALRAIQGSPYESDCYLASTPIRIPKHQTPQTNWVMNKPVCLGYIVDYTVQLYIYIYLYGDYFSTIIKIPPIKQPV